MHRYHSILVAVDFSEHSQKALLRGIEMAKRYEAAIKVVHVMELPTYPVLEDVAVLGMPGVWDTELTEQIKTSAKQRLDTLLIQSGLKLEQGTLVIGNAKTEILNYAEKINADLIVMGSHGVRGFAKLLGSTVDRVIHQAKCDVLAIYLNDTSNNT